MKKLTILTFVFLLLASPAWGFRIGFQANVSSTSTITDNAVVRGDGGARGIQSSGILIDDTDHMTFNNANGPAIQSEAASSTNPTLVPDKTDLDTGVGNAAADAISLISGGVEGQRITEAARTIESNATVCADDGGDLHISTTAVHALTVGDVVQFAAGTGALCTGISASTNYYVTAVDSTKLVNIATTRGGTNITYTDAGTAFTSYELEITATIYGALNVGTLPNFLVNNAGTTTIYDSYTDASNYEGYSIDAGVTTADTLTIKGITAGTGADNLNIAITPAGTGAIVVPAGLVATPAIVSDDADSGFYFGSKGFNWAVDGVKKFGLDSTGNASLAATYTSIHTFHEDNWNEDDATWTMTGTGPLVHVTGNTTTVTATNTEAIVAGTTYKVTIAGTGGGGTATYTLGGVPGTTIAASGAIAITDYILADTTASMIITPASACTVSITSITIEKFTDATGDLEVQGNLTARSPIYLQALTYNPMLTFVGDTDTGMYSPVANVIDFEAGGTAAIRLTANTLTIQGTASYLVFSGDLVLTRLAANSLAMRNSTNAQTFSLYETYTDASNYEGYSIDAGVTTADTLTIKANTAGTGADDLSFNFTTAGKGITSNTMNDHSATPIAPTRKTKTWNFTFAAGDDTDGTCDLSGGQADCFTIPDATTHGHLICFINGTEDTVCDYLIGAAGETVEVSDYGTHCSPTDTCTDGGQDTLCIYDAGTNAVVHNDMGQAETIICELIYD